MSERTRILILAANPLDTPRILINNERDQIEESLEKSRNEGFFEIKCYASLRGKELQEKIQHTKPHIIHFSGHGENEGLIFTDDSGEKSHLVTKEALADLFALCKPNLQAVFLNACYSANQAEGIRAQVPFLIGMNAAIDDGAAIRFSKGFYDDIFNNKTHLDIKKAFNAGLSQMGTDNIREKERLKPVLLMPPFISHCKQDILICFSEVDKEWTDVFKKSLKDDLENALCPNSNLEVQSCSDLKDIKSSAIILLIVSGVFLNEQRENLHSLELVSNSGTHIYAIRLEPYNGSAPDELDKLESRKFYDFSGDVFSRLKNDNYKKELKELVAELKTKLLELKPPQKIILKPPPDITPPEVKVVETPPPPKPPIPPKIEETVPPSKVVNTGTKTDKKPFDYKKYGIIGVLGLAGLGSWKFLSSKPAEPPAPISVAAADDCTYCPKMQLIPGDIFSMGNNRFDSEKPIHTVNIKRFEMGKYEVTQGQWKAVMGSNPSHFQECGDDCPVESVSWNDIQEYLQKLNQKTGKNYRLPSEAEWEYACRGGKQEEYCGSDDIDKVAVYNKTQTQRVGGKAANGFGLHDMSGNVWEWVQDWYHDDYKGAPDDGSPWIAGGEQKYRVLRGGSWFNNSNLTRAANRNSSSPVNRNGNDGFRVARTVP